MPIRKIVLAIGLFTSIQAKAELVTVLPGTHWRWVVNANSPEELYGQCVGFMSSIGYPASYCGNGTKTAIWGGYYQDRTQPSGVYKFYDLDGVVCPSTNSSQYFEWKCRSISSQPGPKPSNPKANGPSCDQPTCGNPIVIGTGNKVQRESDYAPQTAGIPLDLVRTYNGGTFAGDVSAIGAFGKRWSHSIDRKIQVKPNQSPLECFRRNDSTEVFCRQDATVGTHFAAIVTRPDGRVYQFNQMGTQWLAETDVNDRLTSEYGADGTTPTAWKYETSTHDVEQYDASGKIVSITSRGGQVQRFTYSTGTSNDTASSRFPKDAPACANVQPGAPVAAGLLICVTDHWGHQLQFEYDSTKRVTRAIDPSNQSYLYEYDGPSGGCLPSDRSSPACYANNLTAVTYPGEKKRIYHYNEVSRINNGNRCYDETKFSSGFGHLANALTGITDENGIRYASWGWSCSGQAISSEHAGGVGKVTIANGARAADGSNTVSVTSYLGTASAPQTITRNYHFKTSLGVAKNDSVDQPCENCDGMLERTYDANNNIATGKDWQGNKKVFTYDLTRNLETSRTEAQGTTLARTISTEWHPTMRLQSRVAEPLRITSYTYDDNGNMLTQKVQATTDTNGSKGFAATTVGTSKTWTYSYNSLGQVLTKVGPGVNLTHTYDEQGNLSTVTNAASHVTQYSNYDVNGRVGQITDPNGLVTNFAYGPRGWLDSVSVGGEVTSYTYDGVGNLKTATMPDGSTVTYIYDDARRLTDIIDSLGNKITYTLDLAGNRIGEETKDAGSVLTRKVNRVFDTFNRLKQVTGAAQ